MNKLKKKKKTGIEPLGLEVVICQSEGSSTNHAQ